MTSSKRTRHLFGPIKLEVLDEKGKLVDTITPPKRRGLNRIAWSMQVKPPRVPRAAQLAFNASQGPRVPPGVYLAMHNQVLKFPGVTKDPDRRTFVKAPGREA